MDINNFSGSNYSDDDNEPDAENFLFDADAACYDITYSPNLDFKDGILYNVSNLDTFVLTLPDNVRGIADSAFFRNDSLTEIILPEGLEFIEDGAFSNCRSLEKIMIPKNVAKIGNNPFEECPKLQSIEVAPDNPVYCSVNGCLYDKEMTTLLAVPGAATRLEIPRGVSVIALRAASGCETLAEVIIPDSVTRIEEGSFWGNRALRTIQLPPSLTYIGIGAFRESSLEKLVIPGSVTEIEKGAFANCSKLVSAIISEGVKRIGQEMFKFCDSLTYVKLPESLERIECNAFDFCKKLSDIEIPKGVKSIGIYAFRGIKFHEETDSDFVILGDGILYEYRGNENEIVIPDGVKYIGTEFAEWSAIRSVIMPEGVVRIDDNAFFLCDFISNVVLPKSLRSIGRSAFRECCALHGICLNEGLEEIGELAFAECDLKEITLPDTLIRIGNAAFFECALSSVIIPQGVESIGDEVFCGNPHLEYVKIPASVSHIGTNPFANCSPSIKIEIDEENPCFRVYDGCVYTADGKRLLFAPPAVERVEVIGGCAAVERFAFGDNRALRRVVIPDSVTEIGQYAFSDCNSFSTNLPIDSWNSEYGCSEAEYALNFMRLYEAGDPFFEKNREANNAFIRVHCCELLRAVYPEDTAVVRYMANEGLLDVYSTDLCLQIFEEDVEITAILLDYKNRRFSREYLDKYEEEEFRKDVGEAERTPEEWGRAFTFEENSNGCYITGYYGTKKDVIVPGQIGNMPVSYIASDAFSPNQDGLSEFVIKTRENIRSVIIMDGVLNILEGAFCGCSSLTEVVLPSGLLSIDEGAFCGCSSLTEVVLPSGLLAIDDGAFKNCPFLNIIMIPDSVRSISQNAFDENITIKGTKRSYAIEYAKHYGLKYEII